MTYPPRSSLSGIVAAAAPSARTRCAAFIAGAGAMAHGGFVELSRACAKSLASENASRLLAMQVAERNIMDRLEELNVTYRQQRQEAITAELLDVIAGFEAAERLVPI